MTDELGLDAIHLFTSIGTLTKAFHCAVCPVSAEIHLPNFISRVSSWKQKQTQSDFPPEKKNKVTKASLPDGRHLSALSCCCCLGSWDGWRWIASPGRGFLLCNNSLHALCPLMWVCLFCAADPLRSPGSRVHSCLWGTYTQVPGPYHA